MTVARVSSNRVRLRPFWARETILSAVNARSLRDGQ
jgi:hypothetical protein